MRAIWKGAVSFGLVSVPVKVYAATGTNDVRFHQVHEADGGRIRYKRVCSVDGEEVSYPEIAKAYETADGEQVVLTDEDLDQLPLSTSREIDVVEFVPSDQVDPVLFNKAYYLEPERTALKPYTLLREALRATDRVAVVKVALRQRESLALLRVRDDVISLQTLLWPDEVREASFDVLSSEVELRPQEQTMAASLVESLAGDFDPDAFTDGYAAAVTELVEAKISAGEVRRPPAEGDEEGGEGAQVVDLLSALQRSVDRARRDRGEEPAEEAPAPAPRRSRRRTAAAAEEDGGGGRDGGGGGASGSGEDAEQERPAPRRRRTASSSGASAEGAASKGTATKGSTAKGSTTKSSKAAASKGTAAKGTAAKGTASKGTAAKGTAAKGTAAKAAASKGSASEDTAEEAAPARRTRKKSA